MITLPAYFTRFGSKSDGSASLGFSTQELSSDDFKAFKDDLNAFGTLVFRPNEMNIDDMPMEDVEDKSKTPSKRLRAVIFLEWKQKEVKGDFEAYYREKMESIINVFKNRLE